MGVGINMLTQKEFQKLKLDCYHFYLNNDDVEGNLLTDYAIRRTEALLKKKLDKVRELNKHLNMRLKKC